MVPLLDTGLGQVTLGTVCVCKNQNYHIRVMVFSSLSLKPQLHFTPQHLPVNPVIIPPRDALSTPLATTSPASITATTVKLYSVPGSRSVTLTNVLLFGDL